MQEEAVHNIHDLKNDPTVKKVCDKDGDGNVTLEEVRAKIMEICPFLHIHLGYLSKINCVIKRVLFALIYTTLVAPQVLSAKAAQ